MSSRLSWLPNSSRRADDSADPTGDDGRSRKKSCDMRRPMGSASFRSLLRPQDPPPRALEPPKSVDHWCRPKPKRRRSSSTCRRMSSSRRSRLSRKLRSSWNIGNWCRSAITSVAPRVVVQWTDVLGARSLQCSKCVAYVNKSYTQNIQQPGHAAMPFYCYYSYHYLVSQ